MISSTQSTHCAQVSSVIETMFCIRSKFVKSMCLYVDECMMFLDDSHLIIFPKRRKKCQYFVIYIV